LWSRSYLASHLLKNRATILQNLTTVGNALNVFNAASFATAVETEEAARRAQAESAAAVFAGGQLAEELRPAWQRFMEAGEQYLVASNRTAYPETDDTCIYCQQSLSDAARDLLQSYRSYASGVAAEALRAAATQVAAMQQPILASPVSAAIEGLRAALPSVVEADAPPDWASEGQALVARGQAVRQAVEKKAVVSDGDDGIALGTLIPRLNVALRETESALQGLEGDVADKRRVLAEQQARVGQLEARVLLAQYIPDIRTYVENAQWADRVKTLLGRFQGLLRGLTEVSKLASEDALNHDFECVFYEECAALRAPNVTLDFPGRRGRTARRKSVARDHSLAAILSEGEQKVIAIVLIPMNPDGHSDRIRTAAPTESGRGASEAA
jgi:hypothetical protein